MGNTKEEDFEQFYASATQSQIKALAHAAWSDGNKAQETAVEKKVLTLKGGRYYVHPNGDVYEGMSQDASRTAGLERATRDLAVKAAIKRLERDRLAAWVVEHSGEEYDFAVQRGGYFIGQEEGGRYYVGNHYISHIVGTVYMSKVTAVWICEKLNTGEIVL